MWKTEYECSPRACPFHTQPASRGLSAYSSSEAIKVELGGPLQSLILRTAWDVAAGGFLQGEGRRQESTGRREKMQPWTAPASSLQKFSTMPHTNLKRKMYMEIIKFSFLKWRNQGSDNRGVTQIHGCKVEGARLYLALWTLGLLACSVASLFQVPGVPEYLSRERNWRRKLLLISLLKQEAHGPLKMH